MGQVLRYVLAFRLNAHSYEDLARAGVPRHLVDALAPLNERLFMSRLELETALADVLGPDVPKQHASRVVAAARILRLRRLLRRLAAEWEKFAAPSALVFSWRQYILLRPAVLALRMRLRWWRFGLRGRKSHAVSEAPNANVHGFHHNRKQVLSFLRGHRNRSERLMNVLRTIQYPDLRGAKLLCIGPRNEAEMLLLDAYGFSLSRMEAIDLFSYSPRIKLMDMNQLQYADDTFDIYYSSAVIRYSPDIRKTVAESIRVTQPGGIMAYGFTYGLLGSLVPTGSELSGGIQELLQLYAGHVDHVYWQEEFAASPGDFRATVIFRLKKPPRSDG